MLYQIALVGLRIAAAATLGVMTYHVVTSAHFNTETAIILASVIGGNLGPALVDEVVKLVRSHL